MAGEHRDVRGLDALLNKVSDRRGHRVVEVGVTAVGPEANGGAVRPGGPGGIAQVLHQQLVNLPRVAEVVEQVEGQESFWQLESRWNVDGLVLVAEQEEHRG